MSEFETTKRGDLLFKLVLVAAVLLFTYSIGSSSNSGSLATSSDADAGEVLGDEYIASILIDRESEEEKTEEIVGDDAETEEQAEEEVSEAEQPVVAPVVSVTPIAPPAVSYVAPAPQPVAPTPQPAAQNPRPEPQTPAVKTKVTESVNPSTGVKTITTVTDNNGQVTTVVETITPASVQEVPNGLSISQ